MSFGTQKQNSVVLTGDSEIKELSRQKAELHADISAFGADLDAIKKQIENHKDLTLEVDKLAADIEYLVDKKAEMNAEIKTLEKDRARLLSVIEGKRIDLDTLSGIDQEISDKQKELRRINEVIAEAEQNFEKRKEVMLGQLKDITSNIVDASNEKNEILNEIKEIRSGMVSLVVEKENKLLELGKLKESIITLSSESFDLKSKINLQKEELVSIKSQADDVRVESMKEKILADEKIKIEQEKIDEQKKQLAVREGDASKHEAVLETRVNYLRTVKTRLEGHLGRSIDLNIE